MTNQQRSALVREALSNREQAYCPYSGYAVGAAVLRSDGTVFSGANVENASYGLTVCAERVATWKAVVAPPRDVRRLTALALAVDGDVAAPCGACRQVLAEFSDSNMPVLLVSAEQEVEEITFGELLPRAFSGKALNERG